MGPTGSTAQHRQPHSRVEQAGKVAVEALVPADELVAEGQAVHEATLLQPENGAEAVCRQQLIKLLTTSFDDGHPTYELARP